MNRTSGYAADTFRVADLSSYADNLKKLASLNPDWRLSPEEIIDIGKANQKIYKLKFVNRPVELIPDEFLGESISVVVAGHRIGSIRQEDVERVKKILDDYDVKNIFCGIWGGQSKTVDDFGNVESQNQGISATVKITYADSCTDIDDTDFLFSEGENKNKTRGNKKENNRQRRGNPMYCRHCGSEIASNTKFCQNCGAAQGESGSQQPVINIVNTNTNTNINKNFGYIHKRKWIAFFLCLFLGYFGIHRFYVGKIGTGIIWLFTFGFFGIGWVLDLIFILLGGFRDKAGQKLI